MNKLQSLVSTLIGLLVLVLLAVGLAWLLKAQQRLPPSQAVASQEETAPSQDSPLPMPTLVLTPPTPEYPPDYEGPGMPMRTTHHRQQP
ncbi:MAG: hypothetical protein ACUVWR_04105 [Anaerolineae bacterium]